MYNYVSISFPNANNAPTRVVDLIFHQDRYKHEFATVQFRDWDMDYDDVRPGTPVLFSLFGDSDSKEFAGYVHHVTPNINPGNRSTTVHIIGASYFLKKTSQQIYKNMTASDIVVKIAKRNNFAYNVEPHPRVYDQVAQAGLTDMEMIAKLAKQCGYSFRVTNAEIYFQSMTKMYEEERENAPTFYLRDAQNPSGSTIYSFKPLIGESLEHDGEYKSATAVSGVDRWTGKPIQLTNQKRPKALKKKSEPEFFDRFSTVTVANDYDIAKNEALAADHRNRFPYRATAEVLGDPTLHPDMPIYLDGVGEPYGGYWIILATEHRVVSESYNTYKYTTILQLGTDSLGSADRGKDNRTIFQPNPVKKRTIKPNVRQTNKKPKLKLKTGSNHPNKKAITGFGEIKNRAKPMTANRVIVAKKWVSPSGNLRTATTTAGRSKVVVGKLRSKGVL